MFVALLLGVAAAVVGYYGLTSVASSASARSNSNFRDVVVTASDARPSAHRLMLGDSSRLELA